CHVRQINGNRSPVTPPADFAAGHACREETLVITLLYFAAAREAAGRDRESFALAEGADVAALLEAATARHPALAAVLPRCRVAVGHEFAGRATPLAPGAEVAIIPPVAGGSGAVCRLSAEPLSLDEAV